MVTASPAGARPGASSPGATGPVLHGWRLVERDAELAAAHTALASGSAVVTLAGPDGIGLSRVLAEVGTLLAASGREVERLPVTASAGAVALSPLLALDAADGAADVDLARRVLRDLAGRAAPPVLLVDDADLLDELSADVLLTVAVRGLAQLVLTRQDDRAAPHRPPAPGLTRLQALDGPWLPLPALSPAGVADLLGQAVGQLDALSARRLTAHVEGRPGWLRSTLRAGWRAGTLQRGAGVWRWQPDLTERAGGVGPETFAPLSRAGRLAVGLVAAARALTTDELLRVVAGADLDEAFASGLVELRGMRRRRSVVMAHPRDAAAFLGQLGGPLRREVAGLLLACRHDQPSRRADDPVRTVLPALDLGGAVPAELLLGAARALRATDPGEVERVARWLLDGDGPDEVRVEARWLLADALEKTGRHAEAVAVLAAAPAPDGSVAAARHAVTVATNVLWSEEADRDAAERAAAALGGADLDVPGGDEMVAMTCWVHAFPGAVSDAVGLARALQADPRCGDRARVWSTTALVLSLGAQGRADEIDAALGPARASAARLGPGEPYGADQLGWVEVFALTLAGRAREALRVADAGHARAAGQDDPVRLGAWASLRALAACACGRLPQAAADLREVQALLDPDGTGGSYGAGALALSRLGALHAQLGRPQDAAGCVEAARATGVLAGAGLGLLAVWVVRDAAWAGLATPRDLLAAARAAAATMPALALDGAVEALRLGAVTDALPLLRELAPRVQGPAGEGWKLAAAALGRPGTAGMEAAVDVLALAGQQLVAAELLELAAAGRDPVGAARARLRRDALLQELGEVSSPLLARDRPAGLTLREGEVAALVAEGLSSKAVADRLGLSSRTVDNHLGRAFGKLGVTDRGQLVELWSAQDRAAPGGPSPTY